MLRHNVPLTAHRFDNVGEEKGRKKKQLQVLRGDSDGIWLK